VEVKYLEVLVMPNGEIISAGKSLGWKDIVCGESWSGEKQTLGNFLFTKGEITYR
jgi:hypothetical protein